MSRMLTPHPQPLPIPHQHERNRHEQHAQQRQQRVGPIETELVEHGVGEEGEGGAEGGAHEVVARVDGGDVRRVGVAEVGEHGHEEQEDAGCEEGGADDGDDLRSALVVIHRRRRRGRSLG